MSHQQALSHNASILPTLVSLTFQGLACVGPPLVTLAEGLFDSALFMALGNVQRAVQFALQAEDGGVWTRLIKSFDGGRCLHGKGQEDYEGPARCPCASQGNNTTTTVEEPATNNSSNQHHWFVLTSTTSLS